MKLAERLVALARTRAARITLKVLAVALILRALLALAQPLALDAAARAAGLDCEYDELELSLLHGELRLRGLVLRDPLTSEPALECAPGIRSPVTRSPPSAAAASAPTTALSMPPERPSGTARCPVLRT